MKFKEYLTEAKSTIELSFKGPDGIRPGHVIPTPDGKYIKNAEILQFKNDADAKKAAKELGRSRKLTIIDNYLVVWRKPHDSTYGLYDEFERKISKPFKNNWSGGIVFASGPEGLKRLK